MNADNNNIICCSQGCMPVSKRANPVDAERAWKWAYREGFCTLADPYNMAVAGQPTCTISATAPPNMVQHLLLGIPPDALIDKCSMRSYENATGVNPQAVVAKHVEALTRPGICPVRTILDCTRIMDKNGELMLDG